jgi:hypothetical protein
MVKNAKAGILFGITWKKRIFAENIQKCTGPHWHTMPIRRYSACGSEKMYKGG